MIPLSAQPISLDSPFKFNAIKEKFVDFISKCLSSAAKRPGVHQTACTNKKKWRLLYEYNLKSPKSSGPLPQQVSDVL